VPQYSLQLPAYAISCESLVEWRGGAKTEELCVGSEDGGLCICVGVGVREEAGAGLGQPGQKYAGALEGNEQERRTGKVECPQVLPQYLALRSGRGSSKAGERP